MVLSENVCTIMKTPRILHLYLLAPLEIDSILIFSFNGWNRKLRFWVSNIKNSFIPRNFYSRYSQISIPFTAYHFQHHEHQNSVC